MSQKTLWIGGGIAVFLTLTLMAGPLFAIAGFVAGGAIAWFIVKINDE